MNLVVAIPRPLAIPFPPEFEALAGAPCEAGMVLYLDRAGRSLGMRHLAPGSATQLAFPARKLAGDALAFGAAGVVLAHSHPSHDPRPSRTDLDATRRLARALDALDIRLVDHWIVAGPARTSLRGLGLI